MNENNDTSDFLIVLIVVGAFLIYLLTTVWFNYIVGVWYWLKFPILKLIHITPKEVFEFGYSWVFWNPEFATEIKEVAKFYNSYTYQEITDIAFIENKLAPAGLDIKGFVNLADSLIITLYSPFIFFLCYTFYEKISEKERYNTIYSSKSLSIQESKIWPAIKPVIYNIDAMSSSSPLDKKNWWAAADSPISYLKKLGVLEYYKKEDDDEFEIKQEYFKLNVEKLYQKEVESLGEAWSGIENLTFEEKAVLCILLPRLYGKPKDSEKLEALLSTAYASVPKDNDIIFSSDQIKKILTFKWNKLKFGERIKNKSITKKIRKDAKKSLAEAKKIMEQNINKYYYKTVKKGAFKKEKQISDIVNNITNKHHYKKCVFLRMILEARKKSGVIASCQMLWVKMVNREFWYIISQAGRTASFSEVAGVWSHYLAEIKSNRKMAAPRVENAVFACDKYLFKTHDNYEPFNEYDDI